MKRAAIGEQESALLKWLAENGPCSVGQVAEQFGVRHGLARTTLATMMERLRGKGYLQREKSGSVYHYTPSEPHETQMRGLVRRFIERSLGGSLDPFVAYLAEEAKLNEPQIDQLRQLVQDLDTPDTGTPDTKDTGPENKARVGKPERKNRPGDKETV